MAFNKGLGVDVALLDPEKLLHFWDFEKHSPR